MSKEMKERKRGKVKEGITIVDAVIDVEVDEIVVVVEEIVAEVVAIVEEVFVVVLVSLIVTSCGLKLVIEIALEVNK